MTAIKVKRSSEYINALRTFEVLIDGVLVGTIRNGETKEFPVSVGRHSVRVRVDWCSSQEVFVDVDEGQAVDLKVDGFRYSQVVIPIGLGILVLHIFLFLFTDIDYVIYFLLPIVLLLFYYVSFGKKKYLTLN